MITASAVAERTAGRIHIHVLRRVFSFPAMLAGLLVVLAVLTVRWRFDDPDMWWHLRTGQIIWTTHTIPLTDLFSYTADHHAPGSSRVALAGAYLWRLSIGWLLRSNALAVLFNRCTAHSRLCPLLALFGKCKGGLSGGHDHLVFCNQRLFHTAADDRLSSVDFGVAAGAPRAHSKSPLVLLAPAAFCILGELPWNVFSWPCHWRSSSSLLLSQFSDGTARALTMEFGAPAKCWRWPCFCRSRRCS